MKSYNPFFVLILMTLIIIPGLLKAQEIDEIIRQRIELIKYQETFLWNHQVVCDQSLYSFYQSNEFNPVWNSDKDVDELIQVLKLADEHGLNKEDYHYWPILNLWTKHKDKLISKHISADFDILCTDAYLLLAGHLLSGKVNPAEFDSNWFAVRNEGVPSEILAAGLKSGIQSSFNMLLPRDPEYQELRHFLIKYQEIVEEGGWGKVIAQSNKIEKGYSGKEIIQLRKRLLKSGDFNGDTISDLYDDELEVSVREFQRRHGLTADGVIGQNTVAALNVSAQERIDQIKVNMERFRWLKRDLGKNYIMVNIANYELKIVEEDKNVMQKRVAVGKAYRMTPVFSSTLKYLVFNPDWTVPPTILKNDILAVAKKDPAVIQRKNLKVVGNDGKTIDPSTIDWTKYPEKPFPYMIKQDPGPNNALGQVKFIFPNAFNVYLHDTPNRNIFDQPDRALSSGCIRVEKPLELAEYLLNDKQGWGKEKVSTTVSSKKTETVFITKEINVHLQYFTSWVDSTGEIHFRKDIYSRDSLVYNALNQHLDTVNLIYLNR